MRAYPYLMAAGLLLALAACHPGAAEYTESESPNNLVVDNASSRIDLRFIPGSSRLVPRDAARLRALAASGGVTPSDRITVAAAGSPGLAAARFRTVADQLLPYGIVADERTLAVPPNHAVLDSGRYLVTLPPCPNWSKDAAPRFTNTVSSNYGCANISDLGQMVASPADLAEGRPVGLAEGLPAVAAINRYLTDKITLPSAVTLGPVTPATTSAPGGAGVGGQ